LRLELKITIETLACDHPTLPGPEDLETVLVPAGVRWHRRRVGNTLWWVHYTRTAEGVLVRSVNLLW
jgi:hypothetical protein